MLAPRMSRRTTHIIRVGREKSFASDTLEPAQLARLEAVFRAVRWWRDRWRERSFRAEARRVMRESGGLAFIGPGVHFEVPPPFDEFFEAIEIAGATLNDDERLKTISGLKPTRSERIGRVIQYVAVTLGVLAAVGLFVGYFKGFPFRAYRVIAITLMGVGLAIVLLRMLIRLRARLFLVPGGVAVVRRGGRRGGRPRITVFSPADSCLVFRLVHTGKTVILVMELWTHVGKVVRRAVSERTAMSVLAVWRSAQPPLEDDRLEALVTF